MERYLGLFLIITLAFLAGTIFRPGEVLGIAFTKAETESTYTDNTVPAYQPVQTQSSFSEELTEQTTIIPKKTVYQDDPETEAGEDKVLEEGSDGKISKVIKITYTKDGDIFEKELISQETTPAVDKKILRGTKIIWKTLQTPEGEIRYWKKMRVYATHYDQHCSGCDEWTAIGMRAGKGVIAVDPKVIKMRSKVYIPGYGLAVAGDTGGAIKGNIIDLGFDDAKTAGWSARFVDIFLL